jgi:prepilin-type N-terminal cleavage/methylation domain-containing protein
MKSLSRCRPRMRRLRQNRTCRRGFSLVEVLVGLVVLTIGMLGTAGTLLHAARAATKMTSQSGREATELQLLNRLASLPYSTLESAAGCKDLSKSSTFPHLQCVSVNLLGSTKVVRVIITPNDRRLRADTSYLTRSSGVAVSPLAN